jgi:four helix bundle protein
MARTSFENLEVYQLSEQLADHIWETCQSWDSLARRTVAEQLIRAADSVGANIAEGSGRATVKDRAHFVRMARGSLYETKHWLRRAHRRRLLNPTETAALRGIIEELTPRLNAYLKAIQRKKTSQVPKAASKSERSKRPTGAEGDVQQRSRRSRESVPQAAQPPSDSERTTGGAAAVQQRTK